MKRLVVIIFIMFGAFLVFSLYRTYAYDTSVVEETPSTTDLEYTFKIGNSSIKQITVDSGETKYYDVVLGNPNPAKISYSIYYEMVSPSSKSDNFKIEYTSKSTGESTGKVDKEGNITLNLVVTNKSTSSVTVKLGTVAGYVNGGELTLGSGQVVISKQSATNYIESLDDGTTGDSGSGVYKVQHSAISADSSATGEIIPAVDDYRYYGASPNNYVCLDMEGQSTCPDRGLFRIIGSIYEENAVTNLLKVIKATPLTDGTTSLFSWDYVPQDKSYNNIWSSTTSGTSSGATLMKLLNGIYLTRGTGWYYNGNSTSITLNFSNVGLTDVTQSLMNMGKSNNKLSKYYLGGYTYTGITSSNMYLFERGITTSSESALYWDGKIALIYPSDYGYAAGYECATENNLNDYSINYSGSRACSTNDWIYDNTSGYKFTMTPFTDTSESVFGIVLSGSISVKGNVDNVTTSYSNVVHPVFYLDKDVSITSGTGTSSDPYLITK